MLRTEQYLIKAVTAYELAIPIVGVALAGRVVGAAAAVADWADGW